MDNKSYLELSNSCFLYLFVATGKRGGVPLRVDVFIYSDHLFFFIIIILISLASNMQNRMRIVNLNRKLGNFDTIHQSPLKKSSYSVSQIKNPLNLSVLWIILLNLNSSFICYCDNNYFLK